MSDVGYCYFKGIGTAPDADTAVSWYLKSAQNGNAMAAYNMGCCYRHGDGVKKNGAKAVEWYEMGAEIGDTDCMVCIAYMYEKGKCGLKKDLSKAADWYKKALKAGEERAAYLLNKRKFRRLR